MNSYRGEEFRDGYRSTDIPSAPFRWSYSGSQWQGWCPVGDRPGTPEGKSKSNGTERGKAKESNSNDAMRRVEAMP
eukprot:scaffold167741_cov34-Tisochrysis_lutea.AAC.1